MPSPHRKAPENKHIPRPPNAFILFRTAFLRQQHISKKVEDNPALHSKIIGLTWKNLPAHEQESWYEKAKAARAAHQEQHPKYAFRPRKSPPKTKRTRTHGTQSRHNNERCKKIATFIAQGMKGTDLDKAMSDFDRENPPREYDTIRWLISTSTDNSYSTGMYQSSAQPAVSSSPKESIPKISRTDSTYLPFNSDSSTVLNSSDHYTVTPTPWTYTAGLSSNNSPRSQNMAGLPISLDGMPSITSKEVEFSPSQNETDQRVENLWSLDNEEFQLLADASISLDETTPWNLAAQELEGSTRSHPSLDSLLFATSNEAPNQTQTEPARLAEGEVILRSLDARDIQDMDTAGFLSGQADKGREFQEAGLLASLDDVLFDSSNEASFHPGQILTEMTAKNQAFSWSLGARGFQDILDFPPGQEMAAPFLNRAEIAQPTGSQSPDAQEFQNVTDPLLSLDNVLSGTSNGAVSLSLGAPDASDLFLRDDIQFGNSNEARFCPDLPSWTLDTQGLQNTDGFFPPVDNIPAWTYDKSMGLAPLCPPRGPDASGRQHEWASLFFRGAVDENSSRNSCCRCEPRACCFNRGLFDEDKLKLALTTFIRMYMHSS